MCRKPHQRAPPLLSGCHKIIPIQTYRPAVVVPHHQRRGKLAVSDRDRNHAIEAVGGTELCKCRRRRLVVAWAHKRCQSQRNRRVVNAWIRVGQASNGGVCVIQFQGAYALAIASTPHRRATHRFQALGPEGDRHHLGAQRAPPRRQCHRAPVRPWSGRPTPLCLRSRKRSKGTTDDYTIIAPQAPGTRRQPPNTTYLKWRY